MTKKEKQDFSIFLQQTQKGVIKWTEVNIYTNIPAGKTLSTNI